MFGYMSNKTNYMKSYNYQNRQGVIRLDWENIHDYCQQLAESLLSQNFDLVIGIARGGLYPATLISDMLQKEFYPVRLTRRENDLIIHKEPIWKVDVTSAVENKKVMIIDEIADSGQTLQLVAKQVLSKGAQSVSTATVITHSWANPKPDFYAFESDALIIFPWDTRILIDGRWQLHPEIQPTLVENDSLVSKKVVISGSAKLQDAALHWKKFWEDRGDVVLEYPRALDPNNLAQEYAEVHPFFHQQLEKADIQFIMNEDKNGIEGYIGSATFAEMNYGVVRRLVHHQPLEIILLKKPSPQIQADEEINLWLELGWIKLFSDSQYYPE